MAYAVRRTQWVTMHVAALLSFRLGYGHVQAYVPQDAQAILSFAQDWPERSSPTQGEPCGL